jgi:hypothetical protein
VGHITIPVAPISGPPTVRRDPISELTAIPLGELQKLSCCFVSLILVRGDEIRALRRLRHENPTAAHVFVTERDVHHRISPSHPQARRSRWHAVQSASAHAQALPAAISSPMTDTTPEPCSTTSGTRTSSTR